jgi:hypothetical protein
MWNGRRNRGDRGLELEMGMQSIGGRGAMRLGEAFYSELGEEEERVLITLSHSLKSQAVSGIFLNVR